MSSKSEQRRLTQQGAGRLCCVCSQPITLEDAIAWASSGVPTSYIACLEHLQRAREKAHNDQRLKVSPT